MNVGLPNTILVIRQDSAFLADASQQKMASNEIQNSNNLVISELNKKLEQYTFETENIYKEASAIIPELKTLSVAKSQTFSQGDSLKIIPVALYETETPLNKQRQDIFRNWLKAKLKVDTIEIFKKN